MIRALWVAVVFGMIATLSAGPTEVWAAGKKSAPQTGLALLQKGHAQLKARKFSDAISTFSGALTSGKLSKEETAKALYYRGLAYRQSSQPALAIADFSNALWLKAGLSPAQRKDAEAQRQTAYAEAGAAKSGGVATPPAQSGSGWQTAARPAAPAPRRAPEPQPPQQTSSGGVGGFFSNLFGGGSAQPSAAPSRVAPPRTTASVATTSGWSSTTNAARSGAPSVATAPERQPKPSAKPRQRTRSAKRGGIVVQVAALRERAEADALVRRLAARHAAMLKGRSPTVVPRVMGNMGTLYQVRVGPFSTAAATAPFCQKARASGLDCLIQNN